MKRFIVSVGILFLFLRFSVPVCALEEGIGGAFSEEMEEFIHGLPEEVQREYADILYTPEGASEIENIISYSTVSEKVLSALHNAWPSSTALFIRIFSMVLCSGLFQTVKKSFCTPGVEEAFSLCTALVFGITLSESVNTLLGNAIAYLQSLSSLSASTAPLAAAITAASGHLTAAAVSHAALMLLFTLIQNVGSTLLLPLIRISYCLSIAGSVSKFVRTECIAKCIRKTFTVLLGFLTLITGFVIGAQSILSRSADSFSLRTVKFALGNMIPLVGGAVSDALSTVTGSLSLIRSTAGALCVLVLLTLILPILLQLLLHRFVLIVCQGAAEMLGCEQEGKMLSEVHGVFGCILAVVALMSILFLFAITLLTLLGGSW